jgi:uncharacterized protein
VNRVALLDVNVLLALFDPDHVHHDAAHDWFADRGESAWATCPLTENGFLRTAGVLARTREFIAVSRLAQGLRKFQASGNHVFWPDAVSLLDDNLFNAEAVRGHRQLTDVYLLGIAVARNARLATFDRRIPLAAVKGARKDHLEVIALAE